MQGFTARSATTTIHDATATGVSISGIFQSAEDFAVLGLYDAYSYYSHLRLKHLPWTDLSGVAFSFDIEYDHDLDGAMRLHNSELIADSLEAKGEKRTCGNLPKSGLPTVCQAATK